MDKPTTLQPKHPKKRKRKIVLAVGLLAGCGTPPAKPGRDPEPIVETLTPAYGAAGTPVRVEGMHLDAPSLIADFAGVSAAPATGLTSEAVFLIPPEAHSGTITLRTSGGASAPIAFEIAEPDAEAWLTVSAGSFHTCGIKASGRMSCWGENTAGQLAYPPNLPGAYPRPVQSTRRWGAVSGGSYVELGNTCALDNAGSLFCWGDNSGGQYGNGTRVSKYLPTPATHDLGPWSTVSLGTYHACGITGGKLYCWGTQKFYVMGDGDAVPYPSLVTPPAGESAWSAVAAGTLHTCAITAPGGHLYCWGSNRGGQLGDGTFTDSETPVRVLSSERFLQVVAGSYVSEGNTCAVSSTHDLWCWGDNNHGQVGDGTKDDQGAPVKVGRGWQSVTLGGVHACAIDDGGALWCWGNNNAGQTGDPDTHAILRRPALVNDDTDWTQVSGGGAHTCAVKRSGLLYCWGNNDAGELGRYTKDAYDYRPAAVAFSFN